MLARACGMAAVVLLAATPVDGAAAPREPVAHGEDLGTALMRIARGAGYSLIVPSRLVAGRPAPPLEAGLSFEAELARLLKPAGLSYRLLPGHMIVVLASPSASAAESTAPPSPSFPASADVDTVIVVGHPLPAPPGVERLLNDDLRRLQVRESSGLAPVVASLNATPNGPGLVRLSLRGVYGAGDATVPVTFGETPIAGPTGTSADPGLFDPELDVTDVARIDVFKGPQGTDGGVASIAGRVAIRPALPQIREQSLAIASGVTTVRRGGLGGTLAIVANQPLDPETAVRVVGYLRRIPGYVDDAQLGVRDGNHQDIAGVRVALRRRIDERLDLSVSALWQSTRAADGSEWTPALGRYVSDRALRTPASKTITLAQANLTLALDRQDISADAAIYRLRVDRVFDDSFVIAAAASDPAACQRFTDPAAPAGCTPSQALAFADYVQSHTPAELHHRGDVVASVQQILVRRPLFEGGEARYGIYFESRAENYSSEVAAPGAVTDVQLGFRRLRSAYRQLAVFGEATAPIGPARLISGLRLTNVQRVTESNVLTPNLLTGLVASTPRSETHDSGFALRERAEADLFGVHGYIQAARGWRPGGANTVPVNGVIGARFRRDRLATYEMGLGATVLDGRLQLSGDIFLTRWRDLQHRRLAPNGAYAYVLNAGDVRIRGAEAQAVARPAQGWSLRAGGSIADSRLVGDVADDLRRDGAAPGDRLPEIPRFKGFVSLARSQTLAENWVLETSLQISARSAIGSEFSTGSPLYVRSHGVATLDAGINLKSADWMAALDIRNLTDAAAVTRSTQTRQTPREAFSAAPRSVTLSLRREF